MGNNYKPWFERLQDPRWQRKRLEIMQRDKFMCQCCHETSLHLNVHHKYYENGKDPWDYEDKTLITLCKECHLIAEDTKKLLIKMIFGDSTIQDQLNFIKELQICRDAWISNASQGNGWFFHLRLLQMATMSLANNHIYLDPYIEEDNSAPWSEWIKNSHRETHE